MDKQGKVTKEGITHPIHQLHGNTFWWMRLAPKVPPALAAIVALLVSISIANAQDDESSRIDRLRGGTIGAKFKWSGEAFAGLGSRADALGGSISTLFPAPETISSNPAGLGYARGFAFTLDWAPPIQVDPTTFGKPFGLGNLEDELNDSLMETAENNSPGGVVPPGTVEDARLNTNLDMRGGLKGGAAMYGTRHFALAAAFHQPFRLETQFNMAGMEVLAVALDDNGDESQRIFTTINGNLSAKLTINSSSIGLGTRLSHNFSIGATFENFNSDFEFSGDFLPEGIISSAGGDTRAFNDPARVQYDSLFATIKGDWEGSGRRLRGGLGFHPKSSISLDAVVALPFSIDLSGPFNMIYNNIRALNLNAGEDEEVFDIDVLVEDNLTKTEKKITEVPGLNLEFPGSVSVGFSSKWNRKYQVSFVLIKYLENLSYRFNYQQFDSLLTVTKSGEIFQGVDLGTSIRMGGGIEQLTIGVGAVFAESFSKVMENGELTTDTRDSLLLPFISLGGGVDLSSNFRLDYVVSLYESSFLRFSTTYRL